jgi:hypothetical protein
MNAATREVLFSCSFVVIIIAVIPWGYVWRRYVRTPGNAWRQRAQRPPAATTTGTGYRCPPLRETSMVTAEADATMKPQITNQCRATTSSISTQPQQRDGPESTH